MQVVNINNRIIETPRHDIDDTVLFFNHADGSFSYGTILQLQVVKTSQYQSIAYAMQVGDKTLPCVSENLVFDDKAEAKEWIKDISDELEKI